MSTYREAILHARSGGTAYCGTKIVRFLTREEAEPIILGAAPSRRVVIDTDAKSKRLGKALVKDGKIVVETYADPNYRLEAFGLYDVSSGEPVEFRPTEEDIAGTWSDAPIEEIVPADEEAPVDSTIPPEEVVPATEGENVSLDDDSHDEGDDK